MRSGITSGCPMAMAPPFTFSFCGSIASSMYSIEYLYRVSFIDFKEINIIHTQTGLFQ